MLNAICIPYFLIYVYVCVHFLFAFLDGVDVPHFLHTHKTKSTKPIFQFARH